MLRRVFQFVIIPKVGRLRLRQVLMKMYPKRAGVGVDSTKREFWPSRFSDLATVTD